MSTDTNLDVIEARLRREGGFEAPYTVATGIPEDCYSAAVIRESVPLHERPAPDDLSINPPLSESALPTKSLIIGPVTTLYQVRDYTEDGAGWIACRYPGGREPVPVIGGQYYDGMSILAIIAEVCIHSGEDEIEAPEERG